MGSVGREFSQLFLIPKPETSLPHKTFRLPKRLAESSRKFPHTLHPTPYTPYTPHPTPHTLHPLHPTPYPMPNALLPNALLPNALLPPFSMLLT
ncbi:MAG: hypothetical protein F6J93_24625 [Oscillatoria sp. SIO1A7]|nr:hypothetical protein [Oscillatoria sp. SIO1A7]